MIFYAHPTNLISPGDIFPSIPNSITLAPLRVIRKTSYNPPKEFAGQDLRRVYTMPGDAEILPESRLLTKAGEETAANTRVGLGMLLSWGSQVERDQEEMQKSGGKPKARIWLVAPIYPLSSIPADALQEDPETHEQFVIRDMVRRNRSHNYLYLPPWPTAHEEDGYYVDFRRICGVGIRFFLDQKDSRAAALTEDALNMLFSRLMWFFTRAEYFFRPITCRRCGDQVPVDTRFHGQNLAAEAWE
jgi:hypothetical protein